MTPLTRPSLSPLYSLDSTLIDLSLKLFPWSDHNKHRGAVKLHVGLNHGGHFPAFVAVTGGKVHDVRQGRELKFPRGSIVVFDKGYNDYQWYADMENKGIFFVSRQRTNAVYRVLERKSITRSSGITSDQLIELNGAKGVEVGSPLLRRIGYRDAETGKHYVFITNSLDLSARTIADIRALFGHLPCKAVDYEYTVGGPDRSSCVELVFGNWPGGVPPALGQQVGLF